MKTKNLLPTILFIFLALPLIAKSTNDEIRLNQVGYLPKAEKIAAIINPVSDSFKVFTSDLKNIVFAGECQPSFVYEASGEVVSIADFSALQTPGSYVIVVERAGTSAPFKIGDNVFGSLSKASLKAFYYNRASEPILKDFAGIYSRKAGHPDTEVVVHATAASPARPAGTVISTPGGWYDAGDYNKYIVNSGITTFTLLSAYESYPDYYDNLNLNIPESDNNMPDILDEALCNIKWMMTMQDPEDGGVYHKTTDANFSDFVMPSEAQATRYVVAKGTAATLDFAAVMAMTARIYKKYDNELASKALQQAIKAWQWAKANPNIEFKNPSASNGYPAVVTGEYGDNSFSDEFSWCASELYVTTKEAKYYNEIGLENNYDLPRWKNVKSLGLMSLLIHKNSLPSGADTALAMKKLLHFVDQGLKSKQASAYGIPGDFYYWGATNAYANSGMLFLQAYRLTKNMDYFNAAISSLDYLLGRNATSYSFVTGFGTKYPMDIHHRISAADGIDEPVPGLLVGGPHTGSVADCGASKYPSDLPAKSYVDLECSYSTNEIAINWNAPLVFLVGAIHYEYLTHLK